MSHTSCPMSSPAPASWLCEVSNLYNGPLRTVSVGRLLMFKCFVRECDGVCGRLVSDSPAPAEVGLIWVSICVAFFEVRRRAGDLVKERRAGMLRSESVV